MAAPKKHIDGGPAVTTNSTLTNGNVPQDETFLPCIFIEPLIARDASSKPKTISADGLHFIAIHQYRPGSPTYLDSFLNPFWTFLTNLLPLWIAPNMVTTFGGLHCGLAYGVLWYYAPDFDVSPPDWVVALCAYCTMAYYTLDCMDGKQSRRTGTSSPLGQLFDHGFDCICTLAHLATVSSYVVCGGTYWYILLQTTLQFAFFMAQWEEYFTHVLPHCAGKVIGVTEVNYSLGLLALANSLIDREAFYSRTLSAIAGDSLAGNLPICVRNLELRHFLMTGWGIMSVVLMILSIQRVIFHPRVAKPSFTTVQRLKQQVNALSKLATPFALCVGGFLIPPTSVRTRYLSVTMGLAFSLITKKMIVYGMAKMAFAVVQWDAVPFLLAAVWIRCDDRLTREGADFVLGVLCFWYTWRMLRWINLTIDQICDRLDIHCFTIKKRKQL